MASQKIARAKEANESLISALESHPKFAEEAAQRKGAIYFVWDFSKRTDAMFDSILNDTPPPDTPATRDTIPNTKPSSMTAAKRKELSDDALGRCEMINLIIMDTTGHIGTMFGLSTGQAVDYGDAVKNATTNLSRVTG